jgi:hypothetical protein
MTYKKKNNTIAKAGEPSALFRARRRLARWIAPAGEVFSSDMSLVIDALVIENDRLRELLSGRAA